VAGKPPKPAIPRNPNTTAQNTRCIGRLMVASCKSNKFPGVISEPRLIDLLNIGVVLRQTNLDLSRAAYDRGGSSYRSGHYRSHRRREQTYCPLACYA
jgi:hypothetical protein